MWLNGTTGANQFFASLGSIPTAQNNDFGANAAGASQQILVNGGPAGGTYYVMVYGDQINGANPYELLAETGAFFVTGITPDRGGRYSYYVHQLRARSMTASIETHRLTPPCGLEPYIGFLFF